jgi:hypothetical protein
VTDEIRFPDATQRLVIIGRTGSGKTLAALWHLAGADHSLPWFIFDYKRDPAIAQIGAAEIELTDRLPTQPGFYVLHPIPERDDAAVEAFLWKVWAAGHAGLYIDEGYMIGDTDALRAILTQGRSRFIPVIILSQRPVWQTKFVWSEADFFQVFHLNSRDDVRSVRNFVPHDFEVRLADYHSVYYDVGRDRVTIFGPVPSAPDIIEKFRDAAPPLRRRVLL